MMIKADKHSIMAKETQISQMELEQGHQGLR
jgi:hypothetical protein